MTGHTLESTLSGQRAMKRKVADGLIYIPSGFGIELGLTVHALRSGFTVKEIPLPMSHRETGRDWYVSSPRKTVYRNPANINSSLEKSGMNWIFTILLLLFSFEVGRWTVKPGQMWLSTERRHNQLPGKIPADRIWWCIDFSLSLALSGCRLCLFFFLFYCYRPISDRALCFDFSLFFRLA